jgi:hypothetical protein
MPVNVVLGGMILLFVTLSALATGRMVDAGEAADVANLLGMAARFVLMVLVVFNIVMALIWADARMNRDG